MKNSYDAKTKRNQKPYLSATIVAQTRNVTFIMTGTVAVANLKLSVPLRASTLAVKLAHESVFGEDIMLHSTVAGGRGGFSALPFQELMQINSFLLQKFLNLTAAEFEVVWIDCVEAIGKACKRAREQRKKNHL